MTLLVILNESNQRNGQVEQQGSWSHKIRSERKEGHQGEITTCTTMPHRSVEEGYDRQEDVKQNF